MSLNHHDIQAIVKVLDDSAYDELTLEQDGYTLYLKRTAAGWTQQAATPSAASAQVLAPPTADEPAASEAGLIDVRAPMVGTFYRAPQPGAAPFIDIGSQVEPNTVIAIIEVMKLMSSIPAQASGIVREILVQDAQMVEKGQLLLRVKPGKA